MNSAKIVESINGVLSNLLHPPKSRPLFVALGIVLVSCLPSADESELQQAVYTPSRGYWSFFELSPEQSSFYICGEYHQEFRDTIALWLGYIGRRDLVSLTSSLDCASDRIRQASAALITDALGDSNFDATSLGIDMAAAQSQCDENSALLGSLVDGSEILSGGLRRMTNVFSRPANEKVNLYYSCSVGTLHPAHVHHEVAHLFNFCEFYNPLASHPRRNGFYEDLCFPAWRVFDTGIPENSVMTEFEEGVIPNEPTLQDKLTLRAMSCAQASAFGVSESHIKNTIGLNFAELNRKWMEAITENNSLPSDFYDGLSEHLSRLKASIQNSYPDVSEPIFLNSCWPSSANASSP